MSFGIAC